MNKLLGLLIASTLSFTLINCSDNGDVFDIGEIYTHPFSRNVSYQFQRDNKDWKQGEYVIVRQLGFNSEFINDTLSFSNSTTNGKNLYGTVPLRFPNKLINNNTADTVAFTNRLFYKWHITSNGDDFNDALLSYPCDTTTFSKIVVED